MEIYVKHYKEEVIRRKVMFLIKNAKKLRKNVAQEAFRVLKSNIQFLDKENKIKSLTITSCNPREGKTTIALNLAVSIANSGKRVLLVDADFRKPKKPAFPDIESLHLSDEESSKKTFIEEGIQDLSIKNLSLLSLDLKTSDPKQFIDSLNFNHLIDSLSEKFEMLIFDAPSLGGIIDSALISSQTDGTILVVESGLHDYKTVQNAKEQLAKANAKILGVVLSKVEESRFKSYFRYQKYCNKKTLRGKKELETIGVINNSEYISL